MHRQLTIIKGMNALYYALNAVLLPFLPLYFASKGFSTIEIGLLMMVGPFIAVFAQPVWGFISDRLQTVKKILALLWIAAVSCSVLLFSVEGFNLTFTFATLLYFFLMPSVPLLDSLTIRASEEAGVSYGSVRLWGSVGFSSFAAISGILLIAVGGIANLKWIYWGIWVFPLLLLLFLKDVKASAPPVTLRTLAVIVQNRRFLWFLFLVLLLMIPHRMNDSFLGLYMSELGARDQMVGLAWALAAISEVPTFALLYRYFQRFHELALLGIVGCLYTVRWTLYAVAADPMLLLMMQASHTITFAVFWITAVAYTVRAVPPELRSTGQSMLAAVFVGMAGIGGGAAGGWLEARGGYEAAYLAGAGLAAVAGIAFLATHIRIRRADRG